MKKIEELKKLANDPMINPACFLSSINGILEESFINGYKYALNSQWILVENELPYENYINELDNSITTCVLCIAKDALWIDKMIKLKDEGWFWNKASENPIAWMPIPKY